MIELIRRELTVDAPLAAAWHHLAEVEPWPSWAKHINHVELTPKGELTLQSKGTFHLRNGFKSQFRMTEINPSRNWKWVGPFLWLMVHYDHQFEEVGRLSQMVATGCRLGGSLECEEVNPMIEKVNLSQKFRVFDDYWRTLICARLRGRSPTTCKAALPSGSVRHLLTPLRAIGLRE